jgi:hypothetical protein
MNKKIIFITIIIINANLIISQENIKGIEKTDLPAYFSWQDIDGIDYTTPIKNQAPAPTCEAYALVAALETIMQYQIGEIFNPDLSETHLYFYAGGTYDAGYVNIIDAANYLIEYGVPDEGCYPDPHRPFDYPFESLPGWENRTVKIQEWGWIDPTEESIKTALIEYGPLAACFYLCKDFDFYKGGIYKHRWGKIVKGHVMTITGYDDYNKCWIIKNSAGEKWGEDGWLRMSYDSAMFADWYGPGTGVMYIDGAYGNFKPNVPKVQIEKPRIFNTYILGIEFSTFLNIQTIQKGAPRILGNLEIKVTAENTDIVEFYIDNVKQYTITENPFTWNLQTTRGLHTLEVRAINGNDISIDLVDLYLMV